VRGPSVGLLRLGITPKRLHSVRRSLRMPASLDMLTYSRSGDGETLVDRMTATRADAPEEHVQLLANHVYRWVQHEHLGKLLAPFRLLEILNLWLKRGGGRMWVVVAVP
jgi:hypothetical protein